ncbi:nuclear transport factor 2 family protein [Nocardia sp. IFM 10818]
MTTAESKAVLTEFFARLARGDQAGALDLVADDVTHIAVGSTKVSGIHQGKAEVIDDFFTPVFAVVPTLTQVVDNLIAEGDFVVAQTHTSATTVTGRPYEQSYAHVVLIRDGLVRKWTEYTDTEAVTALFA